MNKINNISNFPNKRKNLNDTSEEKKDLKIKNLDISKDIIIEKEDIKYSISNVITYGNYKFNINTRKYYQL